MLLYNLALSGFVLSHFSFSVYYLLDNVFVWYHAQSVEELAIHGYRRSSITIPIDAGLAFMVVYIHPLQDLERRRLDEGCI